MLGGIGEKNFGKQYRQGNRVYDSNAIAMALLSQPIGSAGGHSYLYAIADICINDKGKVNQPPQISYGYAPTIVAEFHGNLPKVIEYGKEGQEHNENG